MPQNTSGGGRSPPPRLRVARGAYSAGSAYWRVAVGKSTLSIAWTTPLLALILPVRDLRTIDADHVAVQHDWGCMAVDGRARLQLADLGGAGASCGNRIGQDRGELLVVLRLAPAVESVGRQLGDCSVGRREHRELAAAEQGVGEACLSDGFAEGLERIFRSGGIEQVLAVRHGLAMHGHVFGMRWILVRQMAHRERPWPRLPHGAQAGFSVPTGHLAAMRSRGAN